MALEQTLDHHLIVVIDVGPFSFEIRILFLHDEKPTQWELEFDVTCKYQI